MDVLTVAVTSAITALTSGIVGALVASGVGAVKDKRRYDTGKDKAVQRGMSAVLWRELKAIRAEAIESGGLDLDERSNLEDIYGAYHDLGGNGTGTRLYDDAMSLPVID